MKRPFMLLICCLLSACASQHHPIGTVDLDQQGEQGLEIPVGSNPTQPNHTQQNAGNIAAKIISPLTH